MQIQIREANDNEEKEYASTIVFSKKNNEFSNCQWNIPKIEGDRQEAQTNVFSKISNISTENRKKALFSKNMKTSS